MSTPGCTETMDFSLYIAEQIGISQEVVSVVLLGLGAMIVALGSALLGLSALSLTRDEGPDVPENWRMVSKLLPLLAQDTLDPDLRALYQKSLYLDALVADVAPELSSPTGTEIGRVVRRELLSLEARRFRDPRAPDLPDVLDAMHARLDEAVEAAEHARPATDAEVRELADVLERWEQSTSRRSEVVENPGPDRP